MRGIEVKAYDLTASPSAAIGNNSDMHAYTHTHSNILTTFAQKVDLFLLGIFPRLKRFRHGGDLMLCLVGGLRPPGRCPLAESDACPDSSVSVRWR